MPLVFELRPAAAADLGFCWPIYREAVQPLTEALTQWNEVAQRQLVEQAVAHAGTSVLRAENADAGWLQVEETGHAVQLRHLYLAAPMRNRGLGSAFLAWMKERADRKRKDLVLEVMTNNPARRLYERQGFKIVTTENDKITMRY